MSEDFQTHHDARLYLAMPNPKAAFAFAAVQFADASFLRQYRNAVQAGVPEIIRDIATGLGALESVGDKKVWLYTDAETSLNCVYEPSGWRSIDPFAWDRVWPWQKPQAEITQGEIIGFSDGDKTANLRETLPTLMQTWVQARDALARKAEAAAAFNGVAAQSIQRPYIPAFNPAHSCFDVRDALQYPDPYAYIRLMALGNIQMRQGTSLPPQQQDPLVETVRAIALSGDLVQSSHGAEPNQQWRRTLKTPAGNLVVEHSRLANVNGLEIVDSCKIRGTVVFYAKEGEIANMFPTLEGGTWLGAVAQARQGALKEMAQHERAVQLAQPRRRNIFGR